MRGPLALCLLACFPVATALVALDARARREARERDLSAITSASRLLPGPDLGLAGGSRHLRYLSLEDPGAAFADQPASLDDDPAGGAVAPPREVFRDIADRPPPRARFHEETP